MSLPGSLSPRGHMDTPSLRDVDPSARFLELLASPDGVPAVIAMAEVAPYGCMELFANAVFPLFLHHKLLYRLIASFLSREIYLAGERAAPVGTLFRETTYATTLLKYLTQTVCQRYLSAVLGDAIHDACTIDYALELNPSRVDTDQEIQRNLERLRTLVNCILYSVYSSINDCPLILRKVFAHLLGEVTRYIARSKPSDSMPSSPRLISPSIPISPRSSTANMVVVSSAVQTAASDSNANGINSTTTCTSADSSSVGSHASNGSGRHNGIHQHHVGASSAAAAAATNGLGSSTATGTPTSSMLVGSPPSSFSSSSSMSTNGSLTSPRAYMPLIDLTRLMSQPLKRSSIVHGTDTNGYPVTMTLSTPSLGLLDSDSLSISDESTELAEDIVRATLFLRVFVPAICHPYAFRITQSPPSLFAARALVQCSKAVQVVANNSDFGDSNLPHFAAFNRFLTAHRAPLRTFVTTLLDVGAVGGAVEDVQPVVLSPRPGYELVRHGRCNTDDNDSSTAYTAGAGSPPSPPPGTVSMPFALSSPRGVLLVDSSPSSHSRPSLLDIPPLVSFEDELSVSDIDDERADAIELMLPEKRPGWPERDTESSDHQMYDNDVPERELPPESLSVPNTAQVLATIWKEHRQQIHERLQSIAMCLAQTSHPPEHKGANRLSIEYSADDELSERISRSASLDTNETWEEIEMLVQQIPTTQTIVEIKEAYEQRAQMPPKPKKPRRRSIFSRRESAPSDEISSSLPPSSSSSLSTFSHHSFKPKKKRARNPSEEARSYSFTHTKPDGTGVRIPLSASTSKLPTVMPLQLSGVPAFSEATDDRPKTLPTRGSKKERDRDKPLKERERDKDKDKDSSPRDRKDGRESPSTSRASVTSPRSLLGFTARTFTRRSSATSTTPVGSPSSPPLTLAEENQWLRTELARVTTGHTEEIRRLKQENEQLRERIVKLQAMVALDSSA